MGLYPHNDIKPLVCRSVSPDYYQELLDRRIAYGSCPKKPGIGKAKLAQYSALLSALKHLRKKYLEPKIVKVKNSEDYFNVSGVLIKKESVFKNNRILDQLLKEKRGNYAASKIILSLISNDLRDNGIKFGVVVIPSKALVIEQWVIINNMEIPEEFSIKSENLLI